MQNASSSAGLSRSRDLARGGGDGNAPSSAQFSPRVGASRHPRCLVSSAAFRWDVSGIAASSAAASSLRRSAPTSAGSISIILPEGDPESARSLRRERVATASGPLLAIDQPKISRPLRFPLGQAGVQDSSASKPCVDCADDEEKPAGTAPSRLDLLARQQLAGGTAHHAVALTDPEFKAIGSSIRNLDFAQAMLKVTSHRFF